MLTGIWTTRKFTLIGVLFKREAKDKLAFIVAKHGQHSEPHLHDDHESMIAIT